jgi:hypothetical protein
VFTLEFNERGLDDPLRRKFSGSDIALPQQIPGACSSGIVAV